MKKSSPYALRLLMPVALAGASGCIEEARSLPQDPLARILDAGDDARATFDMGSNAISLDDDAGAAQTSSWLPIAPEVSYKGHTTAGWTVEWTRWHLSFKDCANTPYFDTTGESCGLDQNDNMPVFFLEGGEYPTRRDGCSVPEGMAILVPLTYFIADGLVTGVNQTEQPEDKRGYAAQIFGTMRDFGLDIDGYRLPAVEHWRIEPQAFSVSIPEPPNYYTCQSTDAPVEGDVSGFVAGIFILLPPPGPGSHVLRYRGTLSYDGFDLVTDVTVHIHVS